MNTLLTSGQIITIAVGEVYTLKTDEVMINNTIYRKADIEISLQHNDTLAEATDVNIGIRKRDGVRNLPAENEPFNKWTIDTVLQETGLQETFDIIQAGIRE